MKRNCARATQRQWKGRLLELTQTQRRVVFVCRSATGESLRSAEALAKLDNVLLLGICEDLHDNIFTDAIEVASVHDTDQLIDAARRLTHKHKELNHIITAQETLLEPVAKAREALDIPGMSSLLYSGRWISRC